MKRFFFTLFIICSFLTHANNLSTRGQFNDRARVYDSFIATSNIENISFYFILKGASDSLKSNPSLEKFNRDIEQWHTYSKDFIKYIKDNDQFSFNRMRDFMATQPEVKFLEQNLVNTMRVLNNAKPKDVLKVIISSEEFKQYRLEELSNIYKRISYLSVDEFTSALVKQVEDKINISLNSEISKLEEELSVLDSKYNELLNTKKVLEQKFKDINPQQQVVKFVNKAKSQFQREKDDVSKKLTDAEKRYREEKKKIEAFVNGEAKKKFAEFVEKQEYAQREINRFLSFAQKYNTNEVLSRLSNTSISDLISKEFDGYVNNLSQDDIVYGLAGLLAHSDPSAARTAIKIYDTYKMGTQLYKSLSSASSLSAMGGATMALGFVGFAIAAFDAFSSQSKTQADMEMLKQIMVQISELRKIVIDLGEELNRKLDFQSQKLMEIEALVTTGFDRVHDKLDELLLLRSELENVKYELEQKINDNMLVSLEADKIMLSAIQVNSNVNCKLPRIKNDIEKQEVCIDEIIEYSTLNDQMDSTYSNIKKPWGSADNFVMKQSSFENNINRVLKEVSEENNLDFSELPGISKWYAKHKDLISRFEYMTKSKGWKELNLPQNEDRKELMYNSITSMIAELQELERTFELITKPEIYTNICNKKVEKLIESKKRLIELVEVLKKDIFAKKIGITVDEYDLFTSREDVISPKKVQWVKMSEVKSFSRPGMMTVPACNSSSISIQIDPSKLTLPKNIKDLDKGLGYLEICTVNGVVKSDVTSEIYTYGRYPSGFSYLNTYFFAVPHVSFYIRPKTALPRGIKKLLSMTIKKNCEDKETRPENCILQTGVTLYKEQLRSTNKVLYKMENRAEHRLDCARHEWRGSGSARDGDRERICVSDRRRALVDVSRINRKHDNSVKDFSVFLKSSVDHNAVKSYISRAGLRGINQNGSWEISDQQLIRNFVSKSLNKNSNISGFVGNTSFARSSISIPSGNYYYNGDPGSYKGTYTSNVRFVAYSISGYLKQGASVQSKYITAALINDFMKMGDTEIKINSSFYDNTKDTLNTYRNDRLDLLAFMKFANFNKKNLSPFISSFFFNKDSSQSVSSATSIIASIQDGNYMSIEDEADELRQAIKLTIPPKNNVVADMIDDYSRLLPLFEVEDDFFF